MSENQFHNACEIDTFEILISVKNALQVELVNIDQLLIKMGRTGQLFHE